MPRSPPGPISERTVLVCATRDSMSTEEEHGGAHRNIDGTRSEHFPFSNDTFRFRRVMLHLRPRAPEVVEWAAGAAPGPPTSLSLDPSSRTSIYLFYQSAPPPSGARPRVGVNRAFPFLPGRRTAEAARG